MSGPRIEQAAFIAWGSGDAALAPSYQPQVAGGLQLSTRTRQRPRPVRLRLDAAGGFHLWSGDGAIISLAADGTFAGKTAVADAARVVDFAVGGDRFFVLYGQPALVRCIDRSGAEVWTRQVTGNRVIASGGSLFVAASAQITKLTELRASDGGVVQEHTVTQGFIRPFAAGGAVVSATYFEAQQRRGVVVYDPATRKESSTVGGTDVYGPLLSAVGADAKRRLYLYGTGMGVATPSLYAVGTDAKQLAREPMESMVAGKDGDIYVVDSGSDRFDVRVYARGAAPRTIAVERPAALRGGKDQRTQVAGVADGRLVIDLLDLAGGLAGRYAVALTGGTADAVPGDTVDVHGAQPLDTWQVDAAGAVYVPVTTADGLAIVRVVLATS